MTAADCLMTPALNRTKYVLVLIWSWELCALCSTGLGAGAGGGRHKWSNYFRMRSLFGSISSRLWPRETQPSSATGSVISSLHAFTRWDFSVWMEDILFCFGTVFKSFINLTIEEIGCLKLYQFNMCLWGKTCSIMVLWHPTISVTHCKK